MTIYAVVPAAGAGKRFGAAIAKQYLLLSGQPVQQYTLNRLTGIAEISRVIVAIAADDALAETLSYNQPDKLQFVQGGAERMDSVLAGLMQLRVLGAGDDDWVLVHDVARPLVRPDDVRRLLAVLADDDVGGLLAVPVRDTMKRSQSGPGPDTVLETVERAGLWHALTPQMFRLGRLHQALLDARAAGVVVTDEAAAIERMGASVRLIAGAADNLKITFPEDLALAEALLHAQEKLGVTT